MTLKSLLLDASTVEFQAGILEEGQFSIFNSSLDDTLTGFFKLITPVCRDYMFDQVIFCEGPGKLMGIRTTLMFIRVLKIIRPLLSIYSYNTLELVHKVQDWQVEKNINQGDDHSKNETENDNNGVCVRKNRTQYYIFRHNQICLIDYEDIKLLRIPIFRLKIQHSEMPDNNFIPLKYNLKDYTHIIPRLIVPNEAIETAFDPENEYKKWEPHK